MKLIFLCERCNQIFVLYHGDVVGIPFSGLPESVARTLGHDCETERTKT